MFAAVELCFTRRKYILKVVFEPPDAPHKVPSVPVPESINAKLYDHQRDGLRWMAYMYQNGMPMIMVRYAFSLACTGYGMVYFGWYYFSVIIIHHLSIIVGGALLL